MSEPRPACDHWISYEITADPSEGVSLSRFTSTEEQGRAEFFLVGHFDTGLDAQNHVSDAYDGAFSWTWQGGLRLSSNVNVVRY